MKYLKRWFGDKSSSDSESLADEDIADEVQWDLKIARAAKNKEKLARQKKNKKNKAHKTSEKAQHILGVGPISD